MRPRKLTWEKVDRIRRTYKPGEIGYKTLAKEFDVHPETIKAIVKGKSWSKDKRQYFK